MPNLQWSRLSPLQLGRYAEYYAKMEFASYGYDVYTSEVDDHGVDFVVKSPLGRFLEIQVKSYRGTGYVFMKKDRFRISEGSILCLLQFIDGELPHFYVIPSTTWLEPNSLFVSHDYGSEPNKQEWGLNLSKKNMPLLALFDAEHYFRET